MLDISSLRERAGKSDPQEDIYDVIVVGGGPAGATAALYAARADLKTVVLDRSMAGGALASTSKIANYPGIPGVVTGLELLQTIRGQAESFGAEFRMAQVLSAGLEGTPKELWSSEGPLKGRAVIVATGKKGRKSRIPGEEELVGRGVSYCATCDAPFYRDGVAAVIGGGEEAVAEASLLARFARKLYLVAPGASFQADPAHLEELKGNPKVEVRTGQQLREIVGGDHVAGIRLSTAGGEEALDVDGVFLYLPGNAPTTDFLEGALETTEQGCIVVDRERATNIPGVYAVGDVVCSYLQQAVVAAADGAIAAMAAEKYIRGRAKARSDWS